MDISREELEQTYDAIILCTGAQKARDLPLEGRMGQGIHFAMDYLTEQTQLLNGEIDEPTITAKGKNVIIIGAGDTGADCVATALRENCKSIVQFNKYTKEPEEIAFVIRRGHLHYLFSKWIMLIKNMKHVLVESLALMVFKLCDMMLIILVMFVVYIHKS